MLATRRHDQPLIIATLHRLLQEYRNCRTASKLTSSTLWSAWNTIYYTLRCWSIIEEWRRRSLLVCTMVLRQSNSTYVLDAAVHDTCWFKKLESRCWDCRILDYKASRLCRPCCSHRHLKPPQGDEKELFASHQRSLRIWLVHVLAIHRRASSEYVFSQP